jgi:hypothetical protein
MKTPHIIAGQGREAPRNVSPVMAAEGDCLPEFYTRISSMRQATRALNLCA